MTTMLRRVSWHAPAREASRSVVKLESPDATPLGKRWQNISEAVLEVGVPVVEGAATAREWALTLLRLASEVEHALMVQYLYAGLSVPNAAAPDGINYRTKILDIAIEEMGHLATVQNLLLLLGGPSAVSLQRDVVRRTSDLNAIPFVLEPVSRTTLAKFVAAERPADVPDGLRTFVDELVRLGEASAGIPMRRVGVIYEMLRWMFSTPSADEIPFADWVPLPSQPRLTAADLRPEAEIGPYLATRGEWGMNEDEQLLFAPLTRAAAVAAIDAVTSQGEGLTDAGEASHFQRFVEIVRALDAGHVTGRSMVASPTMGKDGAENGTVIQHPYTRLWGDAFRLQYTLVVLSIQSSFRSPRSESGAPGLREGLAKDAIRRMRTVIGPVSEIVASLPIGPEDIRRAGPPYDLDPSALEHDVSAMAGAHLEVLEQLAAAYAAIEQSPSFPDDPNHASTLQNLRNADRRHRRLFE